MDFIRRSTTESGQLSRWIEEDGISGVTSNPSIFEKAIAGSHDYDAAIRSLALAGKSVDEIYHELTVEDIQQAADLFRAIYERTHGEDGYVSIEVSPTLARDTEKTIQEARTLWKMVDRPNILVKVPGTKQGLPAIRQLLGEGINVNITLLFGLPRYQEVTEAFLGGLEDLAQQAKGQQPLAKAASVASFFLSRIDVLIDPMLEKIMTEGGKRAEIARQIHGQVAIASAKVAYQMYQEIFNGARFKKLATQGAHPQRLLWASTSTKNPAYSDVKYVEALIGPHTINTLPQETINAYRDHGQPAPRLTDNVDQAHQVLRQLAELGIDLDKCTQQLEDEGVEKFAKSYRKLVDSLTGSREKALKETLDRQEMQLNGYEEVVQKRIADLHNERFSERLWKKDASIWKEDPKAQAQMHAALGWLHVADKMDECLQPLLDFAAEVKQAGFKHVLHMGMGGSSLAPLVFASTFQPGPDGLPVTVLDTTDPEKIQAIANDLPLADTLFIVASKSGTTAEPQAFMEYFYAQVKAKKGQKAGENFVAITDPDSPLVKEAEQRGFRKTFLNFSDIGGRYSALSYFGLVPAALQGLDVSELLASAMRMRQACAASVPAEQNPGLGLGAAMGELALNGHYQVTFITPPEVETLGMWLEQLLAESTGKEGTGLLPVAGEPLGSPSDYGADRLFVYFALQGAQADDLQHKVTALQQAGQPVIIIHLDDRYDLGQEMFRWEFATVTAGAVLGINPLDQPNVQESKDNTNRILDEVRRTGKLPQTKPTLQEGALRFYAGQQQAGSAVELLRGFLHQAQPGDYFALQAYLEETPQAEKTLENTRRLVRDTLHIATTLGYGPRFLHSTGQFHKGGKNTGLFLQLVDQDQTDLPIPGEPFNFGVFKRAQALGDLQALRQHDRRVLSVDLGANAEQGLQQLASLIKQALSGVQSG